MILESLLIDSLHVDPANARLHPDRNLDAIKSSLARFGQQKPIVIDANNVVRAGNGTLAAAKALGWTHLNVVRTELANVEATAFAIADNRTAELAAWDPQVLAGALADPGIGDLGFDAAEIKKWLGDDAFLPVEEPQPAINVGESFQVIVECETESRQRDVFERLTTEGMSCRLLTL